MFLNIIYSRMLVSQRELVMSAVRHNTDFNIFTQKKINKIFDHPNVMENTMYSFFWNYSSNWGTFWRFWKKILTDMYKKGAPKILRK